MAVTAKFTADFSSFLDAINKAEAELVDFGKGAQNVEAKLNRMVDNFSGRKLIQDVTLMAVAIEQAGGTALLTAKELETVGAKAAEAADKMKRLGLEVPPGIQKLADETEHLRDKTDSVFVSFGKLVGSYLTAQAIIAGVKTAFSALTGAIAASITAASEAEKEHQQLVAALKTQGTAVPSVIEAYGNYATALQKTTIFQDDAIESAEKMLVLVGNVMPRDMEKALRATTDLASGLGTDLASAALLVAKAAEGNTSALRRSGIVLDETKAKAEGFGYVLDEIEKKFGGQAQAVASTYTGRLQQLANTWNNVEESIGRVITQNATVLRAFDLINQAIDEQTGELKDNATATNLVSEAVILVVKAFGTLAQALDVGQTISSGFMITLRNMGASLGNVGILALKAAKALTLPGLAGLGTRTQAEEGIRALEAAVKELGERNEQTTQRSVAFGNALQGIVAKTQGVAAELDKTRGKTVALANSTNETIGVWDKQTKAVEKLDTKLFEVTTTYGLLDGLWNQSQGITVAGDKINTVIPLFAKLQTGLVGVGDLMEPLNATMLDFAGVTMPNMASSLRESESAFDKWIGSLNAGLSRLPQLLERALTGGGGISGALKALSTDIGGSLFAAGGPLNALGNSLTKGAFKISETFGNALGSALPVVGSFIGPAIGALFGKIFDNPEKEINPIRQAFVDAAGGLDALNHHAQAAGVTLDALLNAKNAEQYKKAIDDLAKAFDANDQKVKELEGSIGGLKDEIAGLQKSTEVDFGKMEAIAKKYGLQLGDLGPKFQAAQIGATAQGIIDDFDTLQRGLGDVDEALTVMRKPINDLVNDSLQFGTAIPENFQPWVEQLLKTHQLIDENGNEITDLSKLKFGAPIATEFQKVTDKIGELTSKLDDLIKALGNIKPVKIDVGYNYEPFNPPAPDVGAVAMAAGGMGRVTKPTLFLAGENGPEDFAFSGSNKSFGGGETPDWAARLIELMERMPRSFRDAAMGAAV